ncbi:Curli production assembly/transport component CsgG [Hasllibacter halocynthiae]|uniref:Curli production assembly/transport component CsgG n=1 Tax=Hasllibacter halocynthiae TaxID=595589 RepID=A0A2T0X741_9RHOB|nr:CsgG/HfaB family protein [Hasllibacter halocynthiae]PRY94772.1 Curli production assembly/transport component CsgG [Hasllibacter halocynthiae]
MRGLLSSVALVGAMASCGPLPPEQSLPRASYNGPIPVVAATPADAALACLSRSPEVRRDGTVFAVHQIGDLTQKIAVDETGGYVPRDVAGMLVTALSRAGVSQVNRINTTVTEFEIARAREQILGDGGPVFVEGEQLPYRPLERGALRGSDVVIDGSITQLDFNTYSSGGQISLFGAGAGRRTFALTVGADVRVTDTRSTELVMAQAYSKQAVGVEVFGSVFRFFDDELFDVNIGRESQEGLHAGLRWMLAEAAYDIVARVTGHDGSCDALLPPGAAARPVAVPVAAPVAAPVVVPVVEPASAAIVVEPA